MKNSASVYNLSEVYRLLSNLLSNQTVYGCIDLGVIFKMLIVSGDFFSTKTGLTCPKIKKLLYKASCWDYQGFYSGKQNIDCVKEKLNIIKR